MIFEVLVTSTVLIIGIFGLRKLTLGKISMRLRYGLWILVAARLSVPLSVGTSPFSVMNLLPGAFREHAQAVAFTEESGRKPSADAGRDAAPADGRGETFFGERKAGAEPAAGQLRTASGIVPAAADDALRKEGVSGKNFREKGALVLPGLLGAVWIAGFLAAGGYMLFGRQRFVRYLYRNRRELSVETVPDALTRRLSQRGMKVYQVRGLPGPCLAGRHIYIGEGTAAQAQHLTHVLAHEYGHALHRDGFWAFLRCLLAAVYWFDPFVWAAAHAARQDSELACDETAVKLLGEPCRFAYGRTLLALLESAGGEGKCPGMSFMTDGGERSVRERILALTEGGRTKRPVLAAVLAAVVLVCGCAFTGAERNGENSEGETGGQGVEESGGSTDDGVEKQVVESAVSQNRQMVSEENNEEFARIQEEYGEAVKMAELLEEKSKEAELMEEPIKELEEQIQELEERALLEADRAAFQDMLDDYSVMEEKGSREFDVQSYYDWQEGKGGEKPEDGWYLLCREDGGLIYLYGLYTEEFGFRGLKVRIGQDETNLDIPWCASYLNGNSENIRVLEYAENGWPRRFVWKLLAQESSTTEIWRFYSAYRYDTGTIDMKMLSEKDFLSWAEEHLRFDVDQEDAKVYVICDEDMYLGEIDISAYAEWTTEYVQSVPDVFGVALDDRAGAGTAAAGEGGLAVHLIAGLKFEGVEGLWYDGLPILTVQVVEDENSDSGFRLQSPRIDEQHVVKAFWQEKELSELRNGISSAQAGGSAGTEQDSLEKPLVNAQEGSHDLEITFCNPCPDYERISGRYGERVRPAAGVEKAHNGVDMAAPEGADVLAAAEGKVYRTGFDVENGNYVVLWHGQSGQMTYYAHCKEVLVPEGEHVAAGQKIANVGKTGRATGNMLHFAVSYGENWEEPVWEEGRE